MEVPHHFFFQVQEYIQWQGLRNITDLYRIALPVEGVNDIGLFQPFLNMDTDLYSWDTNYIRNIRLVPTGHVSHHGIRMIRYEIDNATFAIDPDLYQTIVGFCNLTNAHNGSSIMLSNPHMFVGDPKYVQMIQGMVQDPVVDITVVDIEPNLGQGTYSFF